MLRLIPVMVAAVMLLAGRGFGNHQPLSVSSDGKSVINDSLDGHLDKSWSCGSLRLALNRVPVDVVHSTVIPMIVRATGSACSEALTQVHRGVVRDNVRSQLGQPDRAPACWIYGWPPSPKSSVDGARICFGNGRVTLVQASQFLGHWNDAPVRAQ